ncbi:MAG TPA: hypothetical protein VFW39_01340 [Sphingomicrobium sp.]|nr:hypothetical protein [Sphingomicrobium sp.]
MNPFEMVVMVVAIVMFATIIIKGLELKKKAPGGDKEVENRELRKQLADVRQRMKVLERIVTDRGAETAAQIEALREHDKIAEDESNG